MKSSSMRYYPKLRKIEFADIIYEITSSKLVHFLPKNKPFTGYFESISKKAFFFKPLTMYHVHRWLEKLVSRSIVKYCKARHSLKIHKTH